MLTGAYTSLLAASTVWSPTAREGDRQDWTKTDNQRHKGAELTGQTKPRTEERSRPVGMRAAQKGRSTDKKTVNIDSNAHQRQKWENKKGQRWM